MSWSICTITKQSTTQTRIELGARAIPVRLLSPYLLQWLRLPDKLIGIRFRHELSLIGFLHEELVSLLIRKPDRIVFRLEVKVRALHEVCARLPAHQWILPSMSLL